MKKKYDHQNSLCFYYSKLTYQIFQSKPLSCMSYHRPHEKNHLEFYTYISINSLRYLKKILQMFHLFLVAHKCSHFSCSLGTDKERLTMTRTVSNLTGLHQSLAYISQCKMRGRTENGQVWVRQIGAYYPCTFQKIYLCIAIKFWFILNNKLLQNPVTSHHIQGLLCQLLWCPVFSLFLTHRHEWELQVNSVHFLSITVIYK